MGAVPSYLDTVVPRFLEFLHDRGLTITVFVVPKTQPSRQSSMRSDSSAMPATRSGTTRSCTSRGFTDTHEAIETEIATAHRAIIAATGEVLVGFRGPGTVLRRRPQEPRPATATVTT